jgi:hypothetical protein
MGQNKGSFSLAEKWGLRRFLVREGAEMLFIWHHFELGLVLFFIICTFPPTPLTTDYESDRSYKRSLITKVQSDRKQHYRSTLLVRRRRHHGPDFFFQTFGAPLQRDELHKSAQDSAARKQAQ